MLLSNKFHLIPKYSTDYSKINLKLYTINKGSLNFTRTFNLLSLDTPIWIAAVVVFILII